MFDSILISTFDTWETHHISNASDDLLKLFLEGEAHSLDVLRGIPVDFELAPRKVLQAVDRLKPRALICCGMAEERSRLNVESTAVLGEELLQTSLDLKMLTAGLPMTEISHDAGRFVCNTLYYKTLEYLSGREEECHCIFIHVPLLTEANRDQLLADFTTIIERLHYVVSHPEEKL